MDHLKPGGFVDCSRMGNRRYLPQKEFDVPSGAIRVHTVNDATPGHQGDRLQYTRQQ